MKYKYTKKEIIYPELSYTLLGCLFDIYNTLGYGHREKYYQNAFKQTLISKKITFKEQVFCPLKFQGKTVGKNFFDFLIDNKIIIELKTDKYFRKKHLEQVYDYLRTSNLKLGIIANFTKDGVKSYRVVNIQ